MAVVIEEKLVFCGNCKCITKHQRNGDKTSFLMVLIHLFMIILTTGIWLLFLIIYNIFNTQNAFNNWGCSVCGDVSKEAPPGKLLLHSLVGIMIVIFVIVLITS
jgi:hypothetical protein